MFITCKVCGGDGFIICPNCKGSGCKNCNDTGLVSCPTCNNSGRVYVED